MLVYFSLFFFALLGLAFRRETAAIRVAYFPAIALYLIFFIGSRNEIGGDWSNYSALFERLQHAPLAAILLEKDIGYALLNWCVGRIGGSHHLVNLLGATAVTYGLLKFSAKQPMPAVAVIAAIPVFLVAISMNLNRQSIAIGLELLALAALCERKVVKSLIFILCAICFHKTSAILVPLVAVMSDRRYILIFAGFVALVLLALGAVYEQFEVLWSSYIVEEKDSAGALIRILMTAGPGLLFLLFANRLTKDPLEKKIFGVMAWLALIALCLLPFGTTAVDRMAFYLMPLQFYVLSRIHRLFESNSARVGLVVLVIGVYFGVLWYWLSFASHAESWLPYRSHLFAI